MTRDTAQTFRVFAAHGYRGAARLLGISTATVWRDLRAYRASLAPAARDAEVLRLWRDGLTYQKIARLLGVTYAEVAHPCRQAWRDMWCASGDDDSHL